MNSSDFANKLREEKSVLVVAGDSFGMDSFIRIGIGSEHDYFLEGLDLMTEFLEELL